MAGTRNPFGRRPHPGSRIHLTRPAGKKNNRCQKNLGKAAWRATLALNENRREISRSRPISAFSGAFCLSAFQFSAFQLYQVPLFPRNPFFPAPGPATGSFNGLHAKSKFLAAKRDGSAATLRKSGTLAKSIRLISADASGLTLGSDRPYAAIHQLGGRTPAHVIRAKNKKALNIPGIGFRKSVNHPGSNIPARPYFPVDSLGQLTPAAVSMLHDILEHHLTP
jgi:phage gpG-like protein